MFSGQKLNETCKEDKKGDWKENKKAKVTRKCVIKQRLKFSDYKDFLLNNEIILKSQQRIKSERHDVSTEENNKIALSSN